MSVKIKPVVIYPALFGILNKLNIYLVKNGLHLSKYQWYHGPLTTVDTNITEKVRFQSSDSFFSINSYAIVSEVLAISPALIDLVFIGSVCINPLYLLNRKDKVDLIDDM